MEDGGVLLGLSSAHRGEYLLDAEHVDVTARALGVALDVGHEFVGSPYAFCARRMSPWSWIRSLFFVRGDSADGSPARPLLDGRCIDVLDAHRSEGREQVRRDRRTVVAQRRALATAVVFGVAQVFGRRVLERGARSHEAGQGAASCLIEDVPQPRAGGRPRSVHAGPIFCWSCRPSGSRYLAYHTAPRARSVRKTCPHGCLNALGHIGGHLRRPSKNCGDEKARP